MAGSTPKSSPPPVPTESPVAPPLNVLLGHRGMFRGPSTRIQGGLHKD